MSANAIAGQPDQPMHAASRVFVAGHRGLVGSAITRRLANAGYRHVLTCSRAELDLRDREAVRRFFYTERPEYVILAAARVVSSSGPDNRYSSRIGCGHSRG